MKVSIVIPLYNEEDNAPVILEGLAKRARAWQDEYEIVPVDDNSADRTPDILREYSEKYNNISVVTKRENPRGMGAALIKGMASSTGDIIVWVMGDLSDDLDRIPAIVDRIKEGYDIVFASRYMKGGSRGELDAVKAYLSSRFTVFARVIFGIKVHDVTNAFRGFRRELIDRIRLESHDFGISPEMAIKAHLLGYKLGEIPCSYKMRMKGKTKFNMPRMVLRYLRLFKYRFYKTKDLTK